MRQIGVFLLLVLSTAGTSSSQVAHVLDPLESRWQELQKKLLLPGDDKTHRLRRRDERILLFRDFVTTHAKAYSQSPSLLKARSELALLCLRTLRISEADQQFAAILDSGDTIQIDIHSSARYGLAQLRELQAHSLEPRSAAAKSRHREAKALLDALITQNTGTRYTDLARAALKRLERHGQSDRPEAGKLAPTFRRAFDLDHCPHTLTELRQQPSLLVFWSADRPATLRRVVHAAGLPRDQVLAFVIGSDLATIKRRIESEDEPPGAVIIRLDGTFLEDIILDYGVQSLPATFLLDSSGRIVGRNLPAHRFRQAVRTLISGKK